MNAAPETAGSQDDTALPLVAITGAGGRVGGLSIEALAGRYRLRLIDLDWPDGSDDVAVPSAERVACDLRDPDACVAAVDSVDMLVHLAAQPSPQIGVRVAIEDVAMPTANLVAAAGSSKMGRMVFASSIHTMGLYDRADTVPIRSEWPTRPCCEYGTAKVFSENLLRLLTERSNISVICLRLGLTGALPTTPHAVSQWLGSDDYAHLLRRSLTAEVVYGTYFGVSAPATSRWDLSTAEADLGYRALEVPPPPEEPDPDAPSGNCLMG
ncbi:MAG: NAD(P)-dependent oxidoreductase [Propionibacteriaceae bacterium]|nr:NAD(P)-dependent oxidoreductase [Propionibacteriaceae bacterium]